MSKMRLALLAAIAATSAANAREAIPADAFARIQQIQSVSMSADGKTLVALVESPNSNHTETALATWNLDNLAAGSVITPSGERMKFIHASALKAGRVLVVGQQDWTGQLGGCGEGNISGATKTVVFKTYMTDTSQKNFSEAFTDKSRGTGISDDTRKCLELNSTASMVSSLPLDPENVVIQRYSTSKGQADYYRYNMSTGEAKLVFTDSDKWSPALFNQRNGEVLVRSELEPDGGDFTQSYSILNPKTGQFDAQPALTRKVSDRYSFDFSGYDEATGKYYVLTDLFSDLVQARMYDPATGKFDEEPLVAHPKYSIGGVILGRQPSNFGKVLGFVVDGLEPEVVYTDPTMAALQAGLKNAFPGQSVSINSYNDDLSRILFVTESGQRPPAFHLLMDRKNVVDLGSERPWIKPSQLGEQRLVTYKARDGMDIPAIVDLPAGWKQGDAPVPAVVQPHGGPWARDSAGWDGSGWVPFMTSRGYAVIRPQYRGSQGFGRKLWMAGDAEWGQKMQDDNDDAANWMVKQGIAVPGKIAIFGYSYGGFAAAAAVVRPNGPFRCAIAGAPVTDLARIGRSWSDNRLQRILQGKTVKGMDPMRNTDKASIPVLLFVGDRDVRTPAFHARGFYDAVKSRVHAKFELIPDQRHQMPWSYKAQMMTLPMIGDFLEKDCGLGA